MIGKTVFLKENINYLQLCIPTYQGAIHNSSSHFVRK